MGQENGVGGGGHGGGLARGLVSPLLTASEAAVAGFGGGDAAGAGELRQTGSGGAVAVTGTRGRETTAKAASGPQERSSPAGARPSSPASSFFPGSSSSS
jgi:hypothetical protein